MSGPRSRFTFATPVADPAAIARCFAEHGIVVLEDFLDAGRCALLRETVQAHFGALDGDLAAHRARPRGGFDHHCEVVCWNPLGLGHPTFVALRDDDGLRAATTACLGPGWRDSTACLVMKSLPGGVGQAWHQDCPFSDRPDFNLNRILYVRDILSEDGAVVVVPGSHRRGALPPGEVHEVLPDEEALTPRAGTLILLHGWTWHRVTSNRSRRERFSINIRALPAGCRAEDPTRYGVYRNGMVDFLTGAVITG